MYALKILFSVLHWHDPRSENHDLLRRLTLQNSDAETQVSTVLGGAVMVTGSKARSQMVVGDHSSHLGPLLAMNDGEGSVVDDMTRIDSNASLCHHAWTTRMGSGNSPASPHHLFSTIAALRSLHLHVSAMTS